MNCAKCCFWSPNGEYICSKDKYDTRKAKKYFQDIYPSPKAYGNASSNAPPQNPLNMCEPVAFWQDSSNFTIIQPLGSYPRFPCHGTQPQLLFPHNFDIRVPRSAQWLEGGGNCCEFKQ